MGTAERRLAENRLSRSDTLGHGYQLDDFIEYGSGNLSSIIARIVEALGRKERRVALDAR